MCQPGMPCSLNPGLWQTLSSATSDTPQDPLDTREILNHSQLLVYQLPSLHASVSAASLSEMLFSPPVLQGWMPLLGTAATSGVSCIFFVCLFVLPFLGPLPPQMEVPQARGRFEL